MGETIIINTSNKGILSIILPFIGETADEKSLFSLVSKVKIISCGPHLQGGILANEIKGYLLGTIRKFRDYPLAVDNATCFQRHVWSCLADIPYGETVSYKELATIMDCPDSIRAVGQALKRNPLPILIPCHRVIGKDGGLRGFSSGVGWKRILLDIEHNRI